MRICLIPLRTETRNPAANLEHLRTCLARASLERPDLVCLPECTLTGYLYEKEDIERYAEPIPGPTTTQMADLASTFRVFLCFGLIEQAETGVFDSAVLLDRAGRICLAHRKIEEKPPFSQGRTVASTETQLGRLGMLICGDLFNETVVQRLDRSLDLLLVPLCRSFDGRSPDPERWLREERQAYLDAVRAAGVPALLVNSLETGSSDPAFGGAMVVSERGELLAESPHGTDQILIWDLEAR
jgi:predicted amidohydrolase